MEKTYSLFITESIKSNKAKAFVENNNLPVEIKNAKDYQEELDQHDVKNLPALKIYSQEEQTYYFDFVIVMHQLAVLKHQKRISTEK